MKKCEIVENRIKNRLRELAKKRKTIGNLQRELTIHLTQSRELGDFIIKNTPPCVDAAESLREYHLKEFNRKLKKLDRLDENATFFDEGWPLNRDF